MQTHTSNVTGAPSYLTNRKNVFCQSIWLEKIDLSTLEKKTFGQFVY